MIIFSISILLLLWIFQNVFLSVFYERYQIKALANISTNIKKNNTEDFYSYLEEVAYANNVCIEVVDPDGNITNFNTKMNGCILSSKHASVISYKKDLYYSQNDLEAFKIISPENDVKYLLYGIRKENAYVFVSSSLEDLNTTSNVLRGQLIYVTFIAILFAILISYFLSKQIIKPILKISEQAKKMGAGSYDIVFEKNGIAEIDELAETLNYVEQDLSKMDELRRDLMANVSHDLKTPLTMIKAYAEMVRDLSYADPKRREEHLQIIIDEVERLNLLVNDILSLSRMQADADALCLGDYNLSKEIRGILKRYEIIKETEAYHFHVKMPRKCMVHADKNKLNQVIYNLINNAINYTGDDKNIYITVTEDKKDYLVEIADTGVGISEEDIAHIWDKYYKNEKNHKRNVVGTGLGLSIVKNILVHHHFLYGVKSKKNEGTTFYFRVSKCKEK